MFSHTTLYFSTERNLFPILHFAKRISSPPHFSHFTYLTKPELNVLDVDVERGFLVGLTQLERFLSGALDKVLPLLTDSDDTGLDRLLTAYTLVVVNQSW